MFSGIIETLGEVLYTDASGSNQIYTISNRFNEKEIYLDQSIAHDGVCLTVVDKGEGWHKVVAVAETLSKTTLSNWTKGKIINLERSTLAGSRLDGHIVQGHVDGVGKCTFVEEKNGSWEYGFEYDPVLDHITIPKGSIAVNGVSLTVVRSEEHFFTVAIIPYTYQHTNFKYIQVHDSVNLEFDVLGKYIEAYLKKMGR